MTGETGIDVVSWEALWGCSGGSGCVLHCSRALVGGTERGRARGTWSSLTHALMTWWHAWMREALWWARGGQQGSGE